MCMCMYMCVCVYIGIYTYICIYTYRLAAHARALRGPEAPRRPRRLPARDGLQLNNTTIINDNNYTKNNYYQ